MAAIEFGSAEAKAIVEQNKLIQARLDAFVEAADYFVTKIECGSNKANSLTKVLVPDGAKPEHLLLEMTI